MKYRILVSGLLAASVSALACAGQNGSTGGAVSDITSLTILDSRTGNGPEATTGRTVTVHYTGWLYNSQAPGHRGSKFDSSRDRSEPFSFRVGAGDVIRGWDEGVAGLKVGGLRTLEIPSQLGYGDMGVPGVIPPRAALVFEVELLDVR